MPARTLVVTNYATNSVYPDCTFTFTLLSTNPPGVYLDADTGIFTWATKTNQPAGTYTNIVTVSDDESLLSATNRFLVVVSNPPPPTLTVPPKQTMYAGQTLTVTNFATSVYPDSSFTFALLSGPTNMDVSDLPLDGVLQWVTTTSQRAGTYTNIVTVADSVSLLKATNRFVIVVSNPPLPTLTVPPKQFMYAGQTKIVTNTATSVYPNSTLTFALVVPPSPAGVNLDPNTGVLTWATVTTQPAGNYTNVVSVLDSVSLLSTNRSFVIVVSNPPPPTLTVPPKQTLFAGQPLTVTNTATSVYPNSIFTFALLSGLTNAEANLDVSNLTNNGVLHWATLTILPAGNYTNVVSVLDSVSLLGTNKSFVIVVSNPPPPTLTVPPRQTIFAGQTLTVTNTATSVYTNSTFTFALLSSPAGVSLNPTTGVLTWATTTAQPAGNYTNTVTVLDSVSLLSATNSFVIIVSTNPPAPTLIVPSKQTIYAGQTLMVTNYANYTNNVLPSSAFTFVLVVPPSPAGVSLNPNTGVLTWPTTIAQPVGTYTNVITVLDGLSHLSATSNFLVQVLPPQPPTLIVPPTQLIYAGQLLVLTNYATNVYPGSTFTFAAFGPTNMDISNLPMKGVLKWTPLAAQAPSANTIYVKVTDNNSLSTISNFLVLVLTTPPPGLTVPPTQTLPVNGFHFTLNTMPDTTWRIDASTNLSRWLPLLTNTADSSGTLQVTDLLATNYLRRYYRAVLP